MVVSITESAFLRTGYGCAQSGEDDYIVGVLLENVLEALLDERHCEETLRRSEMKILFGSMVWLDD